jgi:hypothetical protein
LSVKSSGRGPSRCERHDVPTREPTRLELPRELGDDVEPTGLGGEQEGMLEGVGGGFVNGPGMDRGRPMGAIRCDLVFTIWRAFQLAVNLGFVARPFNP